MKNKFAKNKKEYRDIEFEKDKVLKGRKKIRRKMPTSISLAPETVEELKEIAEKKGIPYQVLMRSFILEGLEKIKSEKAA